MTFLLDVNALIALIWVSHADHERAVAWRTGKIIGLCPISELGFIRISTQSAAFNLSMADARKALADFIRDEKPQFIPADSRVLDGVPAPGSAKTTDFYLMNLARKHGWKLATFDTGIQHSDVEVIPNNFLRASLQKAGRRQRSRRSAVRRYVSKSSLLSLPLNCGRSAPFCMQRQHLISLNGLGYATLWTNP